MSTEWERVNQLFHEAMECAEEERAEYIARALQHNPALQDEVQSLIAAHEEDKLFLENPALGKSLFRQFGGWQRRIIDALKAPAIKVPSGTDRMIGQLLDGKYEIEALCGRGGMGAVYRATHVGTGRRVAVKVIAPELAGNSEFIERFRREAKTIGLLRHPNIVNVTDFGVTGEGTQTIAYLVMEYLEGQTLAERLKNPAPAPIDRTNNFSLIEIEYERMKDRRLMPIDEAIDILSQTCAAMDEAHRLGIMHRDLKPENIWLEPAGANGSQVKILDFGVARMQDVLAFDEIAAPSESCDATISHQPFSITEEETLRFNYTAQQLSRFSSVMGTPKYMSPEQCRGERLDKSSDVYSLGVIAYQLLTGEPPFTGTTSELLIRHREADPPPLREKRQDIPRGVDATVRQALAKDKNARPATAGAFAFLLQLRSGGNRWVRLQADALSRKYRWKFAELALRIQWKGWLLSLLLTFATLKLPGMSTTMSAAVFGFLWLVVGAIIVWGQNATTAACALFIEQIEGKPETDIRSIVAAARRRRRDLIRAAFRPIIPPLIYEELSVEEARRRWATLTAPIRQQTAYALFRRLLVFALALTVSQQILIASAFVFDHGPIDFNIRDVFLHNMKTSSYFWPPMALMIWIGAFSLSLKSAIEQFVIYLAARKAIGAVPLEQCDLLPQSYSADWQTRWRLSWKTYGPACALIAFIIGFHLSKAPWMTDRIIYSELNSVKALHASGVPIPRQVVDSGFEVPVFIRFPGLTRYLIEKGTDVNAPFKLNTPIASPFGGRNSQATLSPLLAALTFRLDDVARALIEHGADIHARDSLGRTTMVTAVLDCPEGIELLADSGADINERTRLGPPLLIAARYQWPYPELPPNGAGSFRQFEPQLNHQSDTVKILIEKGADPNARDDAGRNALMAMSMEPWLDRYLDPGAEAPENPDPRRLARRSDKIVEAIGETLLNAGCDVNAADNQGRSPLIYAVVSERSAIAKLLLKRGANINAKDHNGLSALDWAKKSGNDEIIRFLSSFSSSSLGYGADRR